MATITLATLPSAGALTPASDLLHISQSAIDKSITPINLGIFNANGSTVTPGNPAGTTSTTALMMGLAGSITPAYSRRILVCISGMMANSLLNDGATVGLSYGTGGAPANAAALTGTAVGAAQTFTSLVAAQKTGFSIMVIITGLIIGTPYWIDATLAAITAGTATITNVTLSAIEI